MFLNGGDLRAEAKLMASIEDFRMKSQELLIELDAATMEMMTLVTSKCVSGPDWDFASNRQHAAYESWDAFMNTPNTKI